MPARTPLHEQVAQDLTRRIRAGEWPLGGSLPPEQALCAAAGVSRHTLRHALRSLRDRGLVELRQGAPTRVISCTPPRVYSQDFHTLRDVLRYPSNTVRDNRSAHYVECDAALQQVLKAPVGSSWYCIGAVRRDAATQVALAWTDIYIQGRFARVTRLKNHDREMVFEQIERHFGVAIHRAEVEISAGLLSKAHAAQLGVKPQTPALVILRRYYDSHGDPFEVTLTRHVADRFTFTMALQNLGPGAPA